MVIDVAARNALIVVAVVSSSANVVELVVTLVVSCGEEARTTLPVPVELTHVGTPLELACST